MTPVRELCTLLSGRQHDNGQKPSNRQAQRKNHNGDGRLSIEELTKFLDSINYKMQYGDTDSLFISLNGKELVYVYDQNRLYINNGTIFNEVICQKPIIEKLNLVQKSITSCMQGNGEEKTDYVVMKLEKPITIVTPNSKV